MSKFVIDDWKLKARTVVKLYRKNTNTLVFLLVKGDIVNCFNILFSCHKFFSVQFICILLTAMDKGINDAVTVFGLFVRHCFCYWEWKVNRENFHSCEIFVPRTFAPWNFYTCVTFVPWERMLQELSLQT